MSFRGRLFLAFALAIVLPLALLGWGVRREVERRLRAEHGDREARIVAAIGTELAATEAAVAARLAALAEELTAGNRLRLALRGDDVSRRELLDWGPAAARTTGLAVLEVQDGAGRVLSSGHFRNEYGREHAALTTFLDEESGPRLVRLRTAEGSVLALSALRSLEVGGERVTLVGGAPFDQAALARLSPGAGLSVELALPGAARAPRADESVRRTWTLPFLDLVAGAAPGAATLSLLRSEAVLAELRRSLDLWFVGVLAASLGLGLLLSAWLTARVTRPLVELAEQAARVDLDALDHRFDSDRPDEIGTLARGLGAMTERLQIGAARLREAERRIAMGDLARQVNHDIKNGLIPIRNVVRHLDEVAPAPATLASVYAERRGTLESSMAYLETLARNYARLTPASVRESCEVNALVAEVVQGVPAGRARVRASPRPDAGRVSGDRIAIRRIVENLVGNAVDSVAATGGGVDVSTERTRRDGGSPVVRITVADEGPGMSRAELDRAFDDFYTTKEGGTGLGLSIVRRLVLDLGGALRVDTRPGEGTRVTVELPAEEAV